MSEEEPGASRHRESAVFTQDVRASSDGHVNAVQHGDQYNYIYRNEPPYRVEPFSPTEAAPVPSLLRVPSRLLAARHRIVPFRSRPELDLLEAWRDEQAPGLSVRLVHAEGGQGKTRLAIEFATRSVNAGWSVALARHRSEVASAGSGDEHLTVRAPGLVLIVDYAERWPLQDLITLVRQHRDAARDRLRVLLLARPAGAWWQSLSHQMSKLDIYDVDAVRLQPVPNTPEGRAEMYRAARDRFSEVFGLPEPAGIEPPGDFSDPTYALTLTVHMKALADVDAAARGRTPPAGSDQAGLSSYLLDREHDHWRSAHNGGHGPVRATAQTMGRTVYVATLTRALDAADAATALARTGVADTASAAGVLRDHTYCYPPEDPARMLEPLGPDRLGEDFLALTLPGREEEFGYYATDPWAATVPGRLLTPTGDRAGYPGFTRQAVTILIEAAHRWPHMTALHLQPLLRQHPNLALTAGSAAIARLAELDGIDLAVLEAVDARLPAESNVDLDLGAAALARRLIPHRLAAATGPANRAALLHDLAYRMTIAGFHESALDPIEEAVGIRRQLAEANPDGHLPQLASALTQAGNVLADLGRRPQALAASREAAEINRRLASTDPAAVRLSDLARSLTNLAARLAKSGLDHESIASAQEAVEIRHRLVDADPGKHLPELALTLSNLSGQLGDMKRVHEALAPAQEAVTLYRRFAEADPASYLHPLAASLHNLANIMSLAGRRREAVPLSEEAVQIRRRLVEANAAAYSPQLALALTHLAYRYMQVGRNPDALVTAQEATELYRHLVRTASAARHLPDLAANLATLSHCLRNVGRRAEAAAAVEEAIALHRELAEADPVAYLPDLAYTLIYSHGILPVDRISEGVRLYRRLAEADPGCYTLTWPMRWRTSARRLQTRDDLRTRSPRPRKPSPSTARWRRPTPSRDCLASPGP